MPRDTILQAQIEGMRDAGEMWHDTPPLMPSEEAVDNVSDSAGTFLYREVYREQRESIKKIVGDLISAFAPSTFEKDKFKLDDDITDEILEGFLFDFSDADGTIEEEPVEETTKEELDVEETISEGNEAGF